MWVFIGSCCDRPVEAKRTVIVDDSSYPNKSRQQRKPFDNHFEKLDRNPKELNEANPHDTPIQPGDPLNGAWKETVDGQPIYHHPLTEKNYRGQSVPLKPWQEYRNYFTDAGIERVTERHQEHKDFEKARLEDVDFAVPPQRMPNASLHHKKESTTHTTRIDPKKFQFKASNQEYHNFQRPGSNANEVRPSGGQGSPQSLGFGEQSSFKIDPKNIKPQRSRSLNSDNFDDFMNNF